VIERVEADGDDWLLVVRPPVPGGFKLKLSVHLEELREAEHARLRAWGKSFGGRISIDSSFDLAPDGEGTMMRWTAEVDAAGIFRGLGSQALASVAKQHADRALERLVRAQVTSM
jgi:carbon monoxide dehydrogenase subunit G